MSYPYFTNRSNLGSFGEFCYRKFVISKGISIERTGILEYDFDISHAGTYKIDVKSTQTQKIKFTGKRIRADISYDLVSVREDQVFLYPDLRSPLIKYHGCTIGYFGPLHEEWLLHKSTKIASSKKANTHRSKRGLIAKSIQDIFKGKKLRVIFRGSVSKTRWNSSPDNLPGSDRVINGYEITFFVQLLTVGDSEKIERIYIFNHDSLGSIRMEAPVKRQSSKGIKNVIDFVWFEQNFPSLIFNSLDELKNSVDQ